MPLTLTYQGQTSVPVEIEGLTPEAVRDKSVAEIEQFEIYHGNRKLPLAEFFSVSGDASDEQIVFEGDLSGVHWIGAHMTTGGVRVEGNAGRHVGSEMRGGEIHVSGDASDWVGGEMHRGLIHVRGRAGHLIGAAYRGSPRGMTGGTLLIGGDVGNEVGHTMRRGLIAVGGSIGDTAGFNMIAGTILVFGGSGIRQGAGMRRGTIGLFGPDPPDMLPTFRRACRYRPDVLGLLFAELRRNDFAVPEALLTAQYDLYHGDLLEGGRGEILLPAA
ncbi:MAG: formylmethanofuran dehydrogenase subunit C [Planctomycetes bacterium]|nr:formylmethanofuran dehydrogenase subunit C [Planctomycetota bacterium]